MPGARLAGRGWLVRAGLALAAACAMKSTAWAAVPVLAIMVWVRYAPRAACDSPPRDRRDRYPRAAHGAEALATPNDVKAVKQNPIEFPLGLTKHKTPAASPLPATSSPASAPSATGPRWP